MRGLRITASLTLVTVLSGCATTVTETVQRRELRRTEQILRQDGHLRAEVATAGTMASIHIAREQVCSSRILVEGVEDRMRIRDIPDNGAAGWAAVFGALAVLSGGGLMLGSVLGSEVSDSMLEYGAAVAGLGALLYLPIIYRSAVTGSSTSYQPFRLTVPSSRPATVCGARPAQTMLVIHAPDGTLTELETSPEGALDIDLPALFPANAFRGMQPWSSLSLSASDGTSLGSLDLSTAQQSLADASWANAARQRTESGFVEFAASFPGDSRAGEARRQAAVLQRAHAALEQDATREAEWFAAGDDTARLQSLVAVDLGDGWEVEARCRLGMRADSSRAARIAQEACAWQAGLLDPVWRERHPSAASAIQRHLASFGPRIAGLERAEREVAAALARREAARNAAIAEREERAAAREAARAQAIAEREARQAERRAAQRYACLNRCVMSNPHGNDWLNDFDCRRRCGYPD